MSEEDVKNLNLVQKLSKIRAMSDVVKKEKSGYNYKYTDITSILANITAGMKKYHVSLYPKIVPGTFENERIEYRKTKTLKSGGTFEEVTTENLVRGQMVFSWVNEDDLNQTLDIPWVFIGSQTDPSQAFGTALTYTTRYFLTEFFQIAQPESDVDAYRSKQKEAEVAEEKAVLEALLGEFDTLVKRYLVENNDKSEEVKEFIGKYVKKSNYLAIKDPKIASKLLEDFKAAYIIPENEDPSKESTEVTNDSEGKKPVKTKKKGAE